jgi:hypothetical protein
MSSELPTDELPNTIARYTSDSICYIFSLRAGCERQFRVDNGTTGRGLGPWAMLVAWVKTVADCDDDHINNIEDD